MTTPRVFYFGCVGTSGHCMLDARFQHPSDTDCDAMPAHWGARRGAPGLDTPYCPGMTPDRNGRTSDDQTQGVARVTHVDGWTVLSFWDRSVDERRGSHSTFAIEGTHEFAEAVRLAREAFPSIWKRYKFEVRQ